MMLLFKIVAVWGLHTIVISPSGGVKSALKRSFIVINPFIPYASSSPNAPTVGAREQNHCSCKGLDL
ncbi:MAG: hypothetical protein COB71_05390 [Thiotrichales bacterium]|nr:MAG: hypothetical protein COB71_05390 [Thiotrichales bacterium]